MKRTLVALAIAAAAASTHAAVERICGADRASRRRTTIAAARASRRQAKAHSAQRVEVCGAGLETRYPTREDYAAALRAAADRQITFGLLLDEDLDRTIKTNLGLYDRILAHNPADTDCAYLFSK